MTQFSDLFADVGQPLLFEQLGEQIQYLPRRGEAAEVTAIVTRRTDSRQGEAMIYEVDVLHVTCSADPNSPTGGIAEPNRGDVVWRQANGDPRDQRYSFRGQILRINAVEWTAVFERVEVNQTGHVPKI